MRTKLEDYRETIKRLRTSELNHVRQNTCDVITWSSRRLTVKLARISRRRSVFNFINILCAAFVPIFLLQKKLQSQTVTREKAAQNTFVQKSACKMLIKLTPARDQVETGANGCSTFTILTNLGKISFILTETTGRPM